MRTLDASEQKNSQLIVIVSTILWFVSLLNGTSIGSQFNIYNRTMVVIAICLLYQIVFNGHYRSVNKSVILCIFVLIFQILYTNVAYGKNIFEYLEIYLIPILYSLMTVDQRQMHKIGLIYGIGGGAVLILANYTRNFAGWDGNSVSQICFFSYAVFIASMFDIEKKEHQQRIIIYSCIYFILLVTLNSRSCMLFSAFLLLCEIGIIPARNTIRKKSIIIWLMIPLMIALIIISINNAPYIEAWNQWSQKHFNKLFFSGRDALWNRGFEIWSQHPLFGMGSLEIMWHNSAISCLVGMGIVGYFIWIYLISKTLVNACEYINDNIIFGTVVAFISIWLQQSVELGIINTRANPVIFVLLGLILARTNTLKREAEANVSDLEQINV